MSAAQTGRPLSAAYVKAMHTLSIETTPENVDHSGIGVLWPSLTHLAFRSSVILTSNII